MILSDTRAGREIASHHTVRGLFPSQFSFRISIAVSVVQQEVQLGTHVFNTSLPLGLSPYLTKGEQAGAFRCQAAAAEISPRTLIFSILQ